MKTDNEKIKLGKLSRQPQVMGHADCVIASGSVINPHVTSGDGSIIGAGSVTVKDVPTGIVAIEVTNCTVAGLHENEEMKSMDFRFRRKGIERCLPDTSSSVIATRSLSLKKAIDLLGGKLKTSSGKITLSADEAQTLSKILHEYKIVLGKHSQAACMAHGLLSVIDDAKALYRTGKQNAALKKIGWKSEKCPQRSPHADLFANYLLLTAGRKPSKKSRMEAIEILTKRFNEHSPAAVIKSLQRTRKRIQKTNSTFHIIVPDSNTWKKTKTHNK